MTTTRNESISSVKSSGAIFADQPDCPIYRLKSRDKFGAIREIIDNCSVFGFLDEQGCREAFIQEVYKRELIGTTGIGHNVAIPHGKCGMMDRVRIGLGISREGINFDSIDGEDVHLIFVIGSNPSNQMEYLKSLAFLMNYLKNPFMRTYLRDFSSPFQKDDDDTYRHFRNMMRSQIFSCNTQGQSS